MIRSSKKSVKFSNKNKVDNLNIFINECQKVTQLFVDHYWNIKDENIPSLAPKEVTNSINSWLSSIAIVKGAMKKQKKKIFMVEKFKKEGSFKKARKLQKFVDQAIVSKPELNNLCPELDSRFVKIDLNNETSFDGWLTLSSLGNKMKIKIPFKKSKHFNVGVLRRENIRGLRYKQKSSGMLSHFNYTLIFDKLGNYCSQHGVHVENVGPTYSWFKS